MPEFRNRNDYMTKAQYETAHTLATLYDHEWTKLGITCPDAGISLEDIMNVWSEAPRTWRPRNLRVYYGVVTHNNEPDQVSWIVYNDGGYKLSVHSDAGEVFYYFNNSRGYHHFFARPGRPGVHNTSALIDCLNALGAEIPSRLIAIRDQLTGKGPNGV